VLLNRYGSLELFSYVSRQATELVDVPLRASATMFALPLSCLQPEEGSHRQDFLEGSPQGS